MEADLGWPLARATRLHAGETAVIDGERSITYGELGRRVASLGAGLGRLGVEAGERVGYLGLNSLAHFECVLGIPAQGRVLADLNFRLTVEELAFMVEDAGAEVMVVDADHLGAARQLRDRCDSLRTLVLVGEASEPDCVPYEELVSGEAAAREDVESDRLAAISYTGGTTGRPKGVMLTHANLLANARHNLLATNHTVADVILHPCPMFHAAGVANVFAATWVGACHVVVPRFDPGVVATAIERHLVTLTILVPTMIAMLLDHLELAGSDLSSLRNLQYAASPISPELQRRVVEELGCEVAQFYGMTEAAPTVTHLSPEDHARGVGGEEPYRTRLASVGVPVPGVEAEVREADGSTAAVGEVGEVWVRGANVMRGYWNRPEETAAALVDGWYRSGDAAYADEDGYLYLVDRLKDMIVSGGENVYSIEVERVLQEHSGIREAAVFGIPDRRWGEAVHAVVFGGGGGVALPTEEELASHCRSRLAGFKVPRSFELRSEPLPASGAGKIAKAELRAPHWVDRGRQVG